MLIHLIDTTMTWSPELGWHSAAQHIVNRLAKQGFSSPTYQIIKSMNSDYKTLGYQPESFNERLRRRAWAIKFNNKTRTIAILTGDYFTDLSRKLIPSCLASGIRVVLIHISGKSANFKPVYPRSEDPDQDLNMAPVYREFSRIEDWLGNCRTSWETLHLLQADAQRLVETASTLGLFPESDGPITGAHQLRKYLPPIEIMEEVVNDLAPLYDIELPHPCYAREYEAYSRYNSKGDKHLRPDTTVRSPRTRWAQVEDYTELIICYLMIKWYLTHRIKPTYVWVDAIEPTTYQEWDTDEDYDEYIRPRRQRGAELTKPVRMLPQEARDSGLKWRLRQYQYNMGSA